VKKFMCAAAVVVTMVAMACSSCTTSTTSGASTTASPALADGRHYAKIKVVAVDPDSVTFDVREYFTGEAADQAAVADGVIKEGESMPDDIYVRNDSKETTTLDVAPSTQVGVLKMNGGSTETAPMSFAEFEKKYKAAKDPGALRQHGYWITVTNGEVTAIEEQFHP